jgi:hypothetical protein
MSEMDNNMPENVPEQDELLANISGTLVDKGLLFQTLTVSLTGHAKALYGQ